jgi:hypothetical protein
VRFPVGKNPVVTKGEPYKQEDIQSNVRHPTDKKKERK